MILTLRRKLWIPLLCALLAGCSARVVRPQLQTGSAVKPLELSGVLSADLFLGGDIRLTGDLLIPAGRRLELNAGSRILVVGTESTKIDPEFLDKGTEILVRGSLLVHGEASAPVVFLLDAATPQGENWAGIELVSAETVHLGHVDIIGAEVGLLVIDSAVRLEAGNILNSRTGILLQGAAQLDYQGGLISGGDAGLLCFDQARVRVASLQIRDNLEEGLYLAAGCLIDQEGLRIERNDLGLVAVEAQREALASSLRDNRVDFKALPKKEPQ